MLKLYACKVLVFEINTTKYLHYFWQVDHLKDIQYLKLNLHLKKQHVPYPKNIELKLEFNEIKELTRQKCLSPAGILTGMKCSARRSFTCYG